MTKPIVSFGADGIIPAGSPKINFLEIPGRPFTCEDFNIDEPSNSTDRVDELGHFNGSLMTLGKRTGSVVVHLNSLGETSPERGCTFVASVQGVAFGWVVTSVGRPRPTGDEIKLPVNFQVLANPLVMVPVGDYTFASGGAIEAINFACNGRHTVDAADWALETASVENFRPTLEDREELDCGVALPAGLDLTAGQLTGTPTVAGDYYLRFKCTDSRGKMGYRDIQITVTGA